MKKICLYLFLALCLCFGASPLYAASKPLEAHYAPYIYSIGEGNYIIDKPGIRDAISETLTNKLKELSASGKLPFTLKTQMKSLSNTREDFSDDAVIGLMPLMTLGTSFDSAYVVGDQVFYKSILISALNVAICSADPERQGFRILAVVPMAAYHVIGDTNNPQQSMISDEKKVETFIAINKEMIKKQLDFKKTEKYLKNWQTKVVLPITYQVTSVEVSSQGARKVFDNYTDEIESIIGNFFTAEYARRTGNIMYPPLLAEYKAREIGDNLRAFTIRAPSDAVEMTFEEPKHKISLDFSGIASKDFARKDKSEARKDIIYKAWLKGRIDNKPFITLDSYTSKMMPADGVKISGFVRNETDVYKEIMFDLSTEMAEKLAKEK